MYTLKLSMDSKTIEQVRTLVTKPGDLSSNPKTHNLLFDSQMHALALWHLAPVQECTENEKMNIIQTTTKMYCTKFSKNY